MRRVTAAVASWPAFMAFCFDARNSGLSTSFLIASVVGGPAFELSSIGKLAAFSMPFPPSLEISRAGPHLLLGQFEPFGKAIRRALLVGSHASQTPTAPRRGAGSAPTVRAGPP